MAIQIITATIPLRDPALAWDELGPGRYKGEVLAILNSGDKVAVSVEPKWLENGAGVSLDGNARWIEDDGTTRLSDDGKHVEANLITTVTLQDVRAFGLKPLAKDVARIIVGEAPLLMRAADLANGVVARPVFMLDETVKASASIQNAADVIKAKAGFSLSL